MITPAAGWAAVAGVAAGCAKTFGTPSSKAAANAMPAPCVRLRENCFFENSILSLQDLDGIKFSNTHKLQHLND
jgi:hypothetical protein